jgi:GNAT superfamily N-acetyltransferase
LLCESNQKSGWSFVQICACVGNGKILFTMFDKYWDTMIRSADKEEAQILTKISIESKSYWVYPKEYFEIWSPELTITTEHIEKNDVFVFEREGAVVGYYSLIELVAGCELSGSKIAKGFWLEHMFILPKFIGQGIGTILFAHLRKRCEMKGIRKLGILADPNARGFYEKMGCTYQGEIPSTIAGRTTPMFELRMNDHIS